MKFSLPIFLGLSAIIWWISIHGFYFFGEYISQNQFNNPSIELYDPIIITMSGFLAVALAILPAFAIEDFIVGSRKQ